MVPHGYGSNNSCLYISKDKEWMSVSKAIKDKGSIPGIQLSSTWPEYKGNKNFVSSSKLDIDNYQNIVKDISTNSIDKLLYNLQKGIELSISNGFRHIQIHAAHGYLISLLIDKLFCDNYQYMLKRLREIISIYKNVVETSLRFSLLIGVQNLDKQRSEFFKELNELSFDFFDISFGFYNINKNMIYPESTSMLKSRLNNSLDLINDYKSTNFILSGRSLYWYDGQLPENAHLGICRDLIANPEFITNKNNKCDQCGDCHYYSRGENSLTCSKWNLG